MSDFQVIIIGGRPAGASLAIRLGQQNIKTLIVDKMTFPSHPSVPSAAIIYSHHLEMLDELSIPQNELFHADGRIDAFVVEFVGFFNSVISMNIPEAKYSYAYGADRAKFDNAIWEHIRNYNSVNARNSFSVTQIVKENGKVIGIKGQTERGKQEVISADLVVGADGRFSFAAKQFEAATLEEHNQYITNSYMAYWENVEDGLVPHAASMYNTAKGQLVLIIPTDTRRYIVATYTRPERHNNDTRADKNYLNMLQEIPDVWMRLKDAERMTSVVGLKGIQNGYRQPTGNGWALVGDAFHYKDPLDGQGIYDAMLEAKYLGEAIHEWQKNDKTWKEVGQKYAKQVIEAIHPMMLQTVNRVKNEIFTNPPPFIIKTLIRWLLNSPEYQHEFMRRLVRIPTRSKRETIGVIGNAVGRGIVNDLLQRKSNA